MEKVKKLCGKCCWFYGERTEGDGDCVMCPVDFNIVHCESKACDNFISRNKVRHSSAVLAQFGISRNGMQMSTGSDFRIRYVNRMPSDREILEAIQTITRYVNVMTKKL